MSFERTSCCWAAKDWRMISFASARTTRARLSASGAWFRTECLLELAEQPRGGRASPLFRSAVADVRALACEPPARRHLPLARRSFGGTAAGSDSPGLSHRSAGHPLVVAQSGCARPWRHRSWIFLRNPAFAAKAGRILDIVRAVLAGTALRPRGAMSRAKTSIQVRRRAIRPAVRSGRPIYPSTSISAAGLGLSSRLRCAPREGIRPL